MLCSIFFYATVPREVIWPTLPIKDVVEREVFVITKMSKSCKTYVYLMLVSKGNFLGISVGVGEIWPILTDSLNVASLLIFSNQNSFFFIAKLLLMHCKQEIHLFFLTG